MVSAQAIIACRCTEGGASIILVVAWACQTTSENDCLGSSRAFIFIQRVGRHSSHCYRSRAPMLPTMRAFRVLVGKGWWGSPGVPGVDAWLEGFARDTQGDKFGTAGGFNTHRHNPPCTSKGSISSH